MMLCECLNTSTKRGHALIAVIHQALAAAGLPPECVQVPPTADREAVAALLKLDEYIDVVMPGFTSRPEQYYGECEVAGS